MRAAGHETGSGSDAGTTEVGPVPGDDPGDDGLDGVVLPSIAGRISRFPEEPRPGKVNDINMVAAMLQSIGSVQQERDGLGRGLAASGQALIRMRHPCSLLRGV